MRETSPTSWEEKAPSLGSADCFKWQIIVIIVILLMDKILHDPKLDPKLYEAMCQIMVCSPGCGRDVGWGLWIGRSSAFTNRQGTKTYSTGLTRSCNRGNPKTTAVIQKLATFVARAVYCMMKTDDGKHFLMQGLPSGVRATDLFNTLTGIIFTMMADEIVAACGWTNFKRTIGV